MRKLARCDHKRSDWSPKSTWTHRMCSSWRKRCTSAGIRCWPLRADAESDWSRRWCRRNFMGTSEKQNCGLMIASRYCNRPSSWAPLRRCRKKCVICRNIRYVWGFVIEEVLSVLSVLHHSVCELHFSRAVSHILFPSPQCCTQMKAFCSEVIHIFMSVSRFSAVLLCRRSKRNWPLMSHAWKWLSGMRPQPAKLAQNCYSERVKCWKNGATWYTLRKSEVEL